MAKKKAPKVGHSSLAFRKSAMKGLTNEIGVYVLCDLDEVPVYVGKSADGIRERAYRHLTSARSDIIANRLVDVWEVAFVKAWEVADVSDIAEMEAVLFRKFDSAKPLMNGSIPRLSGRMPVSTPAPDQTVQIMSSADIEVRRDPMLRLPRQIEHIGRLVDHILSVKDTPQLRRSLAAHFERLDGYRGAFLKQGAPVIRAAGVSDEE